MPLFNCGFNFEKEYGEIGKGFIESHHLTPLYPLKGQKIDLDPKKRFCSALLKLPQNDS